MSNALSPSIVSETTRPSLDTRGIATASNVAAPVQTGAATPPNTPRVFLPLPGSDEMPRRRFKKDEYFRLLDVGVFEDREPCELIEGEIVAKMPQGLAHVVTVMLLQELLRGVFGPLRVITQAPLIADEYNVPEPDVLLLREVITQYREAPTVGDTLLAIEVSVTTGRRDRGVKAVIYARAGIAEFWVLDPAARTLTVLREPNADGYQCETTYTETETVAPLSAPDAPLRVAAMLPPPPAASAV